MDGSKTACRVLSVLLAIAAFIIYFLVTNDDPEIYYFPDHDSYEIGFSDGYDVGYDVAAEEFCYEGDPQYGGWDEGYEAGYNQYPRDVFSITETTETFIYNLFEQYCDGAPIADEIDKAYYSWRRFMLEDRALR